MHLRLYCRIGIGIRLEMQKPYLCGQTLISVSRISCDVELRYKRARLFLIIREQRTTQKSQILRGSTVYKRITTTLLSAVLSIALAAPAMAQIEVQAIDDAAIPAADTAMKSPVYIVMMRDDPVVAYEGDISGYKATKPDKGKKINPNSARVKKYVRYLNYRLRWETHCMKLIAVKSHVEILKQLENMC